MRYAVLVKPPDDHPGAVRLMGSFDKLEKAEALCAKIREAVNSDEETWLEEATGFAYVIPIEPPRIKAAIRFATRGN